jgi:hypothetical protein
MGVSNPEIYLQARINRAINNAALGNRPPGPMTEKEWEFLKQGELPANASNADVARVFTEMARMESLEAEYQRQRAMWLDENRDFRGFTKHWEANRADIEKEIWTAIPQPDMTPRPAQGGVQVGEPVPVNQPNMPGQPTQPVQQPVNPQLPQLPGTL